MGRSVPPYAREGSSLFFETFNRGKRSVLLDLDNAAGPYGLRGVGGVL